MNQAENRNTMDNNQYRRSQVPNETVDTNDAYGDEQSEEEIYEDQTSPQPFD